MLIIKQNALMELTKIYEESIKNYKESKQYKNQQEVIAKQFYNNFKTPQHN